MDHRFCGPRLFPGRCHTVRLSRPLQRGAAHRKSGGLRCGLTSTFRADHAGWRRASAALRLTTLAIPADIPTHGNLCTPVPVRLIAVHYRNAELRSAPAGGSDRILRGRVLRDRFLERVQKNGVAVHLEVGIHLRQGTAMSAHSPANSERLAASGLTTGIEPCFPSGVLESS